MINLDTIRCSADNVIVEAFNHGDKWFVTKGNNRYGDSLCRKVVLENNATIWLQYFVAGHLLLICFSAAKIQNGCNAIPYSFENYKAVTSQIEEILKDELNLDISCNNFNHISRVDLNMDFPFSNETDCDAFSDFTKKIIQVRNQKKAVYDSGVDMRNGSRAIKFYRKDKDPHLSLKERNGIANTQRFEIELRKRKIKQLYPSNINLEMLLKNPIISVYAWNREIDQYALGGRIMNDKQLKTESELYLTEKEQDILKAINNRTECCDRKKKAKRQAVIRKLKRQGICPYSCECAVEFKLHIIKLILTIRRRNASCASIINSNKKPTRKKLQIANYQEVGYLDSS